MKVVRIEHKKYGFGPYEVFKHRVFWGGHSDVHGDDDHPSKEGDNYIAGGLKIDLLSENEYFGFKNLSQLFKWFSPKEIDRLRKIGYRIYSYDAKVIWMGAKQLTFNKRKYKRKLVY